MLCDTDMNKNNKIKNNEQSNKKKEILLGPIIITKCQLQFTPIFLGKTVGTLGTALSLISITVESFPDTDNHRRGV